MAGWQALTAMTAMTLQVTRAINLDGKHNGVADETRQNKIKDISGPGKCIAVPSFWLEVVHEPRTRGGCWDLLGDVLSVPDSCWGGV